VANLAKADPLATVNRISSSQAVPLLQRALLGNDPLLKSLAVLTLARIASVSALPPMSLQASKLEGKTMVVNPKWVDGVSILYPVLKRARSSPMKKPPSDFEVISQGEFDLVFIHGINGHPITTWRVENEETSAPVPVLSKIRERGKIAVEEGYRAYMSYLSDPEKAAKEIEAEEAICWPRDWLPHYLPRARIMTVSYDIALTRWSSSETVPLKQQAAAILQKLRLFGIGEKPLIFIAHSFGGLIVKEMLLLSSKKEEYRDVVEQTKAILFFSTPHRGSPVADLANGPGDLFFRGSSAVTELYPNNWYLHHLNAFLPKVAPSIRTLSVGEIETCFVSSLSSLGYACYHIVPDESSNPNWKGDHHRFIKLPFNHRQVCKPQSVDDTRFQLVLDFLRENAPSSSASDML
jgi:pimeloyl-ACP methyl ester carboxylesterase